MKTIKLSPEQGENSASLLRKSVTAAHPRLRERLVALALIAEGLPAKVVAQRLGRNRGPVEYWVQCFNTHGLDGLSPGFRGQPGALLSAEELAQLHQVVQRPPRAVGLKTGTWTGKAVVAFVKRTFGKTISAATARRYLRHQGFRRKRPRTRFTTADPEAQRAFAHALQQLEHQRARECDGVYGPRPDLAGCLAAAGLVVARTARLGGLDLARQAGHMAVLRRRDPAVGGRADDALRLVYPDHDGPVPG
jgi:transposase